MNSISLFARTNLSLGMLIAFQGSFLLSFGLNSNSVFSQQLNSSAVQSQSSDQNSAIADEPNRKEQMVKAAYLYNFCKYFAWPDASFADKESDILIGVLGNDSLGNQLDLLAEKRKARKRSIVIHRFETMEDYQPCHLLFVPSRVTTEDLISAVETTDKAPLLIVSDGHVPPGHGAVVTFFWKDDKTIGFEIDLNAAHRRRLEVSAKLLKIAKVTRR
ncbi:MAG: YfiR family protein [Planctomycetota bacterium]